MARKVPFKSRGRKSNLQEALVLCLNQRRHDAEGNRLKGYSFDEIAAMGPEEREKVRAAGWLGKDHSSHREMNEKTRIGDEQL